MQKLQSLRVQGNTRNPPLRGLLCVVFPISNHRMPGCRKLHADLVLQSRDERDPQQRGAA
jgi:hypothetical protein